MMNKFNIILFFMILINKGCEKSMDPIYISKSNLIAFTSQRDSNLEIYKMDYDGNNQINLTNDPAEDLSPKFTPDGTKILYGTYRDNAAELCLMDTDGGNKIRLTNKNSYAHSFDIHPNGSEIIFISKMDGKHEIYSMDINGNNMKRLTISVYDDYKVYPKFSPNGSKIIFQATQEVNNEPNSEIFIMNSDGNELKNLTKNPAADHSPQFFPDGFHVLYYSVVNDSSVIYSMEANGENKKSLAKGWDPVPSSDGSKIVYSYNFDIYLMDFDGSNQTNLTKHSADDYSPVFSSNESKIAFVTNRDKNYEIYMMDLEGKKLKRLTNNSAYDFGPVFQPKM